VDGEVIASIRAGLVILLGIGPDDTARTAEDLAGQIAQLRIFPDPEGKMNLSVLDAGGEALVVPQFTLYADTSRGHRPSFTGAAPPDRARKLVDEFKRFLEKFGVPTGTGRFGAHMLVQIENDGPVTITLDTEAGDK
jgi:D-tyrosyl-tRNA(Tyr) deacylase